MIPEKTGPKRPKKLTGPYQEYIDRYISDNPKASSNEIAKGLKKDKGIDISKRTVERYRSKKNASDTNNHPAFSKEVHFGWQEENITVIDCDLGHSGAESSVRDGFKQLVADVGSGEVGAVASIV